MYEYFAIYPGNICNFVLDKCLYLVQLKTYDNIQNNSVEWHANKTDVLTHLCDTYDIESLVLEQVLFDNPVQIYLPNVRNCIIKHAIYNIVNSNDKIDAVTYSIINANVDKFNHKLIDGYRTGYNESNSIDLFSMISMPNLINLGIINDKHTQYVCIYNLTRYALLNNLCILQIYRDIFPTQYLDNILILPQYLTQITCPLNINTLYPEDMFLETFNLIMLDVKDVDTVKLKDVKDIKCLNFNYATIKGFNYNIVKNLKTSEKVSGSNTKMAIR
jgi:hypothetical protein